MTNQSVFFKHLAVFFFTIYLLPIYIIYLFKSQIVKDEEIRKYKKDIEIFKIGFFRVLYERPEYINVLYMRMGNISRLLKFYKRPYLYFYLPTSDKMGGGIHADHPHGTHLNLNKCGEGLHVKHNVTIGINHGGIPTLGNNVYVGCGACILGNVIIGNNVKVGANCVIISDVPDNATVVGNPAYIVRLNGTKVKIKL